MTNRITDILLFVFIWALATIVRALHELHKTWKLNLVKASSRFVIGCILAWLVAGTIPEGYSFWGMTKIQTTAITAFTVWLLWVEIIDFILSKDLQRFISLVQKK